MSTDFWEHISGSNEVMHSGKDEENEDIIVLHRHEGFFTIAQAVLLGLNAELDNNVDGEPHAEEFDARISIYDIDDADMPKAVAAINAWFKSTSFTEDHLFEMIGSTGMKVSRLLSIVDWNVGFSDTYDMCCDCYRIIHTQPNHYGDCGRFRQTEDGIVCRDCDKKNPERYLDEYLEDITAGKMRGFHLDMPAGWKQIGEVTTFMGEPRFDPTMFESGLHIGQRDNPKTQYAAFKAAGVDKVIFDIETGQFDIRWSLWVPEEMLEAATTALANRYKPDAEGPGDRAARALKSVKMEPSKPGFVNVVSIDTATGEAHQRHVSHDDFVKKGIKA